MFFNILKFFIMFGGVAGDLKKNLEARCAIAFRTNNSGNATS